MSQSFETKHGLEGIETFTRVKEKEVTSFLLGNLFLKEDNIGGIDLRIAM